MDNKEKEEESLSVDISILEEEGLTVRPNDNLIITIYQVEDIS